MTAALRTALALGLAGSVLLLGGCSAPIAPVTSVAPPAVASTPPPPEPTPEPTPTLADPAYPAPGPSVALLERLTDDLPLGWGTRLVNLGNNGLGEVYQVQPDGSLDPAPTGWVAVTWEIASAFIDGTALEGVFDDFYVTNNTDSGIEAYVVFGERMGLGMNLAAFRTPSRWLSTFVHELGHAFTTDATQLRAEPGCDTFRAFMDYCVIRGGKLHQWYQDFWSDYGDDAPSPTSKDMNLGGRFRSANPSHFVSSYAAVNFFEDIAEHFRVFVEEPLREDTAGVVMWEKQMWFAQFPEMLEFRAKVREAFAGLY